MFLHKHPYAPFIPKNATKLIVGTLPPPRFSTGKLKGDDVDFCYGSRDGQLWPILDSIFNLNLVYETTEKAIQQRKEFLIKNKIGICDIVESCQREKVDASDIGMQDVQLRNLIGYIKEYRSVETLLFTGGNSKNGPEYFFRKHLKDYNKQLELVSNQVPRIHQFELSVISKKDVISSDLRYSGNEKSHNRTIRTISLTAPSGSANRAVGSMDTYKKMKNSNPNFTTLDFRILQYRDFFLAK